MFMKQEYTYLSMVYTQKSFIFFHIQFHYICLNKKNCSIPFAAPGHGNIKT